MTTQINAVIASLFSMLNFRTSVRYSCANETHRLLAGGGLVRVKTFDLADGPCFRRVDHADSPTTLDCGEPLLIGRTHACERGSTVVGEPTCECFRRLHDWRNRCALGSGLVHLVVGALGVRPLWHDVASVARQAVVEPAITKPFLNLFLVVWEVLVVGDVVTLFVLRVYPACRNPANFSAHGVVLRLGWKNAFLSQNSSSSHL